MARYHTSWLRFWAAVVDGIVFLPLSYLNQELLSPDRAPWIVVTWGAATYSAYWLYSVLLHARFGQTVGKKLLRVKVLDVHEQRTPTFQQALLRDVGVVVLNTASAVYLAYLVFAGRYVSGAESTNLPGELLIWASLAWLLLELVTMLTNEKRRAFHDYIAGTVVVRDA